MAYRMVVVGAMFCTCAGRSVPQAEQLRKPAPLLAAPHLGAVLWHAWQAPAPCQPQRASRQLDQQHAEGIPVQVRKCKAIDQLVQGWKASRHSQRGDNPPTRDSVSNQRQLTCQLTACSACPAAPRGLHSAASRVADGFKRSAMAGSRRGRQDLGDSGVAHWYAPASATATHQHTGWMRPARCACGPFAGTGSAPDLPARLGCQRLAARCCKDGLQGGGQDAFVLADLLHS